MTKIDAIIAGGGSSSRMNGINKLTYKLNQISGFTTLEASVFPFTLSSVNSIILTYSSATYDEALRLQNKYPNITLVEGGITRSDTIKNALKVSNSDYVLIHDGARPYLTTGLIEKIIKETMQFDSAIPYTDSTDSLFDISTNSYTNRQNIKKIQTPQGFNTKLLKEAISKTSIEGFDEGIIFNEIKPVHLVEGEKTNIKITTQDDLNNNIYVGTGFDVHKLVPNRKLILGGVDIKHYLGLLGHSDADVLTHAIMDALLGAASMRDIGYYFPDNDDKYLNISSLTLLQEVNKMLNDKHYRIVNINAEIMAEKPKLKTIIPDMIKSIALTLGVDYSQISISCTTTEKLGIIGEEKGIACYAICSLEKI